ncbi:hypothetical protein HK100_008975, partial [Physocladia obscura]
MFPLGYLSAFLEEYVPVVWSGYCRVHKLLNKHKQDVAQNPDQYKSFSNLSSADFNVLEDKFLDIFTGVTLHHISKRTTNVEGHVDNLNNRWLFNLLTPFGNFSSGTIDFLSYGIKVDVLKGDLFIFDAATVIHRLTDASIGRYSILVWCDNNAVEYLLKKAGKRDQIESFKASKTLEEICNQAGKLKGL